MSKKQQMLIKKARSKCGTIYSVAGKAEWTCCFSFYKGKQVFWFNTKDNLTHAEIDN